MEKWVTQFLVVFFMVPLVVEGVLMESMLGLYLLNHYPVVFHTLNIIAIGMFGVFLLAVVVEMVHVKFTR